MDNDKFKYLKNPDGSFKHVYSKDRKRVLNPLTGRFTKTGSRVYRRLVREGVLNPDHYTFYDDKTKHENDVLRDAIKIINKNNNINNVDAVITTTLLNKIQSQNRVDLTCKNFINNEKKTNKTDKFRIHDPKTEYETDTDYLHSEYDYSESES